MDVFDFFQGLGIDTKNHKSGSFYTKCPKCHDERRKQSAKELLVNLDTGWTECFHCGWSEHILKGSNSQDKPNFTPAPAIPQKFISPEPIFNWVIPDAVIEPQPKKPLIGKYTITWYYRNIQDKLTGAKKMEYVFTETGFNRADSPPLHLFSRDSGYYPCIFYERDLYTYPHATVILVESEKTAAIMRKKFKEHLKDFIYLAVGGANGLTDAKAKALAGRKILICYDCDNGVQQEDGTIKGPKGREGAESAHAKLAGIASSYICDIDPTKNDGTDLADIEVDIDFIRSLSGKQKYPPELIQRIRTLNRSGEFWKKTHADTIGAEMMIDHQRVYDIGRAYFEANKTEFGVDSAPLLKKIEYFLTQRYEFRKNSISKRIFYRDKSDRDAKFVFCNYNDVWRLLQHNLEQFGKKVRINITDVSNLLESSFVQEINPFEEYFHTLPNWDGVDHITKLANYVQTSEQSFWVEQFKKALVRMIACSYQNVENRIIMVMVQTTQETGKDSMIRFLCPPELREYYKEDPMTITKDAEMALCQNFLWNLTELDSLTKKEISEIKGIISRSAVKQRRAYGRQEENMLRTVSFWGTTNKVEFLTDVQNSRWLCFNILSIDHKYHDYINHIHEVDITKVWAQAWYLYKSGFAYNLNDEERAHRDDVNRNFEFMSPEKQLIIKYLTPCKKDTPGAEFIVNVEILEYIIAQTGGKLRLAPENVGRSMSQLEFVADLKKVHGKAVRGYWALRQPLLGRPVSNNGYENHSPQPSIFDTVPGVETEELPF